MPTVKVSMAPQNPPPQLATLPSRHNQGRLLASRQCYNAFCSHSCDAITPPSPIHNPICTERKHNTSTSVLLQVALCLLQEWFNHTTRRFLPQVSQQCAAEAKAILKPPDGSKPQSCLCWWRSLFSEFALHSSGLDDLHPLPCRGVQGGQNYLPRRPKSIKTFQKFHRRKSELTEK